MATAKGTLMLPAIDSMRCEVEAPTGAEGDHIGLSVGIAAYNEAGNIGNLIQRLQGEMQNHDQMIVVSSGSTDRTSDIVLRYCESDPRIELFVEQNRKGKPSAINKILAEFGGEMLL